MDSNEIVNKKVSLMTIIIGAIGLLGFILLTVVYVHLWQAKKENKDLKEQIDNVYIAREKQLRDSVFFWHDIANEYKERGDSAFNLVGTLERADSINHYKYKKKINEIPHHNYSESDRLSDSLLRWAGVK